MSADPQLAQLKSAPASANARRARQRRSPPTACTRAAPSGSALLSALPATSRNLNSPPSFGFAVAESLHSNVRSPCSSLPADPAAGWRPRHECQPGSTAATPGRRGSRRAAVRERRGCCARLPDDRSGPQHSGGGPQASWIGGCMSCCAGFRRRRLPPAGRERRPITPAAAPLFPPFQAGTSWRTSGRTMRSQRRVEGGPLIERQRATGPRLTTTRHRPPPPIVRPLHSLVLLAGGGGGPAVRLHADGEQGRHADEPGQEPRRRERDGGRDGERPGAAGDVACACASGGAQQGLSSGSQRRVVGCFCARPPPPHARTQGFTQPSLLDASSIPAQPEEELVEDEAGALDADVGAVFTATVAKGDRALV